jgi:hypothetical protein
MFNGPTEDHNKGVRIYVSLPPLVKDRLTAFSQANHQSNSWTIAEAVMLHLGITEEELTASGWKSPPRDLRFRQTTPYWWLPENEREAAQEREDPNVSAQYVWIKAKQYARAMMFAKTICVDWTNESFGRSDKGRKTKRIYAWAKKGWLTYERYLDSNNKWCIRITALPVDLSQKIRDALHNGYPPEVAERIEQKILNTPSLKRAWQDTTSF